MTRKKKDSLFCTSVLKSPLPGCLENAHTYWPNCQRTFPFFSSTSIHTFPSYLHNFSKGILYEVSWNQKGILLLNNSGTGAKHEARHAMDQITIKTPNPKCRLYWCLIEFIDWIYSQSQSCWYFRPLFWTVAPLPSLWRPLGIDVFIVLSLMVSLLLRALFW